MSAVSDGTTFKHPPLVDDSTTLDETPLHGNRLDEALDDKNTVDDEALDDKNTVDDEALSALDVKNTLDISPLPEPRGVDASE